MGENQDIFHIMKTNRPIGKVGPDLTYPPKPYGKIIKREIPVDFFLLLQKESH